MGPPKEPPTPTGPSPPRVSVTGGGGACDCTCQAPFVSTRGRPGAASRVGNVSDCAYPCYSPTLGGEGARRDMMTWWLGTFGVLCALVTSLTVASFLIDMERFNYPERPIFFISACYLLVSIGYLIRLGLGHRAIACDADVARVGANHPAPCVIVFLLVSHRIPPSLGSHGGM